MAITPHNLRRILFHAIGLTWVTCAMISPLKFISAAESQKSIDFYESGSEEYQKFNAGIYEVWLHEYHAAKTSGIILVITALVLTPCWVMIAMKLKVTGKTLALSIVLYILAAMVGFITLVILSFVFSGWPPVGMN